MIRTPFTLEKMTYDNKTGMVIYCPNLHVTLKRNFQLLPAVKWLALLLAHILRYIRTPGPLLWRVQQPGTRVAQCLLATCRRSHHLAS
jgi:hypothetical protein